jgi:hypothetical protein
MTIALTPAARARLDAHLDAVESALAITGNSREQRRGVVDDLEVQILDMLAHRSPSPTLDDVETVLAKLDPPTAYGSTEPSTTPGPPRTAATRPPITERPARFS